MIFSNDFHALWKFPQDPFGTGALLLSANARRCCAPTATPRAKTTVLK